MVSYMIWKTLYQLFIMSSMSLTLNIFSLIFPLWCPTLRSSSSILTQSSHLVLLEVTFPPSEENSEAIVRGALPNLSQIVIPLIWLSSLDLAHKPRPTYLNSFWSETIAIWKWPPASQVVIGMCEPPIQKMGVVVEWSLASQVDQLLGLLHLRGSRHSRGEIYSSSEKPWNFSDRADLEAFLKQ